MRALVTGGSGFIGSHVVDKLLAKGVDVRIFDMVEPSYWEKDQVQFYQGSLLDPQALRMAMSGIDAVFHLGAVADVNQVNAEPAYSEEINVRGTFNILEAMRLSKGRVNKIVYGSTTWVYQSVDVTEVDETTPLKAPAHLYTATKLAGEHYVNSYHELYGIDYTIMRYGIPYGTRARDGAVVPIFVGKAMRGEPLTIAGDGMQFRKFVYVEDLAEGNVLGLKPVAKNQIYNLDGTQKVSIKQIAETIKELMGDVTIEYTPARAGDFGGKEISSKKAKEQLNWEPTIDFKEGVRRYIEWYKQRASSEQASWERVDAALKS